jgi:hypothetical protein
MTNATRRSVWGFSCYLRYQVNDPIDVIAGPLAPSPQPVALHQVGPDISPSSYTNRSINADASLVRIGSNGIYYTHLFLVLCSISGAAPPPLASKGSKAPMIAALAATAGAVMLLVAGV